MTKFLNLAVSIREKVSQHASDVFLFNFLEGREASAPRMEAYYLKEGRYSFWPVPNGYVPFDSPDAAKPFFTVPGELVENDFFKVLLVGMVEAQKAPALEKLKSTISSLEEQIGQEKRFSRYCKDLALASLNALSPGRRKKKKSALKSLAGK